MLLASMLRGQQLRVVIGSWTGVGKVPGPTSFSAVPQHTRLQMLPVPLHCLQHLCLPQ